MTSFYLVEDLWRVGEVVWYVTKYSFTTPKIQIKTIYFLCHFDQAHAHGT